MVNSTKYKNNQVENQIIGYFNKVIKNAAANYYKRKVKRQVKEALTENFDKIVPNNYTIDSEIPNTIIVGIPLYIKNDLVFELLTSLKEKEALFLVYYYFQDLYMEEIAQLLDMKISGVYSLKRRVIEKIRRNFSY